MVLLSAAAIAVATSTRATALLADDATLVSRAVSLANESAELAKVSRDCASVPVALRPTPRVVATVTPGAPSATYHTEHYSAALTLSPFARATTATLTLSSGRGCE